jgi:hypothetical protein
MYSLHVWVCTRIQNKEFVRCVSYGISYFLNMYFFFTANKKYFAVYQKCGSSKGGVDRRDAWYGEGAG